MRKSLHVYYDDIKDADLIKFIDSERGSITRKDFILSKLYEAKNLKYSNNKIVQVAREIVKEEPEKEEQNNISTSTVNMFKGNFKK